MNPLSATKFGALHALKTKVDSPDSPLTKGEYAFMTPGTAEPQVHMYVSADQDANDQFSRLTIVNTGELSEDFKHAYDRMLQNIGQNLIRGNESNLQDAPNLEQAPSSTHYAYSVLDLTGGEAGNNQSNFLALAHGIGRQIGSTMVETLLHQADTW